MVFFTCGSVTITENRLTGASVLKKVKSADIITSDLNRLSGNQLKEIINMFVLRITGI